jgi:hypothetical protein
MSEIVRCVGRRRIVVVRIGQTTVLEIALGDPPRWKHLAKLELEPAERDKLIEELMRARAER